jgi:hypothetical protein
MMRWMMAGLPMLLVVAVCIVPTPAIKVAWSIGGIPTNDARVLSVASTSTPAVWPASFCRQATGSPEAGALVQVLSNGIYFVLNGGTPASNTFVAATNDFIEVVKPSLFKAVMIVSPATLFGQCFTPSQ